MEHLTSEAFSNVWALLGFYNMNTHIRCPNVWYQKQKSRYLLEWLGYFHEISGPRCKKIISCFWNDRLDLLSIGLKGEMLVGRQKSQPEAFFRVNYGRSLQNLFTVEFGATNHRHKKRYGGNQEDSNDGRIMEWLFVSRHEDRKSNSVEPLWLFGLVHNLLGHLWVMFHPLRLLSQILSSWLFSICSTIASFLSNNSVLFLLDFPLR